MPSSGPLSWADTDPGAPGEAVECSGDSAVPLPRYTELSCPDKSLQAGPGWPSKFPRLPGGGAASLRAPPGGGEGDIESGLQVVETEVSVPECPVVGGFCPRERGSRWGGQQQWQLDKRCANHH